LSDQKAGWSEGKPDLKSVIVNKILLLFCLILNSFTIQLQDLYFRSPQESVEIITQLLKSEDWKTLSSYYSFEVQDDELLDSLKSGDYFIRKERPEVSHPGGFWKYRQPFPPGFTYSYQETIAEDIIKVHLEIEIDQGEGMIQRGQDSYLLKKLEKGYQLLPEE